MKIFGKIILYGILICVIVIVLWIVLYLILLESKRKICASVYYNPFYFESPFYIFKFYNKWIEKRIKYNPHPYPDINENFPQHLLLENNWKVIQKEALTLYNLGKTTKVKTDKFFETIADDHWKKYYIKWYGDILDEAKTTCPETCKLISQIPSLHLCMFSILEPGAKITIHSGPSKGVLRYHLGLSVPKDTENCFISVGNIKYSWKDGKGVLLDDTYEHFVQNNTEELRIILLCDIQKPLKGKLNNKINTWICNKIGPLTFEQNIK